MLALKKSKLSFNYKEQKQFLYSLNESENKLSDELDVLGLGYDDLVYERSHELAWKGSKPLTLLDFQQSNNNIPIVSFFTGCGGMDLGFEAAGFEHVAAFEFNELFCKTLRKNKPNWDVFGPPIHNGDVSKVDEVISTLENKISTPFEGIFIGGPPCQPFSIASNQRFSKSGDHFKRLGFQHEKNGNLLFDYIDIIKRFRPKVFVIENVAGLRDLDKGKQLSEAIQILEKDGYIVETPFIVDAANYGVPQQRLRLFVIGTRTGKQFYMPEQCEERIGSGSVLSEISTNCNNNETRRHNIGSVLRYMKLDYGERDQLGRVDRLNPILPSKTVIAGGVNGGGRSHLHPEIPRTLSVRECAKLQTFPDKYTFVGSTARQFTQVGNAVPPLLAVQIGIQIKKVIF